MSERSYYGKIDPEIEFEKAKQMASSVRFYAAGSDGGFVDKPGSKIDVETCVWQEQPVPMFYWGVGEAKQRIYFHQAFSFHPDAVQELLSQDAPPFKGPREGRIFVVDTGWPVGGRPNGALPRDEDTIDFDVAYGHGPAIVDVIRTVGGEGVDVQLRQVRFANSALPGVPIFRHPDGGLVRGFSEDMLLATLNELRTELRLGDVVNLSLGAVACPGDLGETPGDKRLFDWLTTLPDGVEVVVAAGNHGCDVPSWPAAYGSNLRSPSPALSHVHAVGSRSDDGTQTIHDFSARGSAWVHEWENGLEVGFNLPPTGSVGRKDRRWTGTSFAAPQFAVKRLPMAKATQPGGGPQNPDRAKAVADQASPAFGNAIPAGGHVTDGNRQRDRSGRIGG